MASIFFDDPANQPQQQAQQNDAAQFVNELASRYGITVGETDIANLAGKNPSGYSEGPNDYANFKNALEAQYDLRAHNETGGGPSGSGGGPSGGMRAGNFSGYLSPDSIQPWNERFTSPTAQQARDTPGYQFQLEEGIKALDKSAASRGRLLGGGQIKAQTQFGQGLADTTYGETDARLFRNYADAKDSFFRNEENRYSSQRSNLLDQYGFMSGDRNYDLAANNQYFNQGLQGGYYGLASENQAYNQNRTTNQDLFNNNTTLAGMGNPGSPQYTSYLQQMLDSIYGKGNADASGIINSANASGAGYTNAIQDALREYFRTHPPAASGA